MNRTADTRYRRDARVLRALGSETRLLIVYRLAQGECCVCDLVELFDMEYSKLSYHLKKLKEADLVATDRDGNFVTYRPTERGKEVIEIIRSLC